MGANVLKCLWKTLVVSENRRSMFIRRKVSETRGIFLFAVTQFEFISLHSDGNFFFVFRMLTSINFKYLPLKLKIIIRDLFQKNWFLCKTSLQILVEFLTLFGNAEWKDFTVPLKKKKDNMLILRLTLKNWRYFKWKFRIFSIAQHTWQNRNSPRLPFEQGWNFQPRARALIPLLEILCWAKKSHEFGARAQLPALCRKGQSLEEYLLHLGSHACLLFAWKSRASVARTLNFAPSATF